MANDADQRDMVSALRALEPRIRRAGGHSLGEDLYQELWTKILAKPRYAHSPRGLIMRIAKHLLVDLRRQEARQFHEPLSELEVREARVDTDPLTKTLKNEQSEYVHKAVDKLKAKQAEAILARYVHAETAQQTADRLKVPVETVRTRQKSGEKELRRNLRSLDPRPDSDREA